MSDGDRPLDNDWVLAPDPIELDFGKQNGGSSGVVTKKGRMTKDEVRDWLKMLFNITDEASVDLVWEEMERIRKKKDGEC